MKLIVMCLLLAVAGCQDKRAPAPTAAPPGATANRADAAPVPPPTPIAPAGTPMQMQLNSTPSGAQAFVDGVAVGVTPVNHTVYVTETPIEFTFKLSGHQDAVYAFVPKTAGEVHGRLMPSVANPAAPASP